MSAITRSAELFRLMPDSQKEAIVKVADRGGMSIPAVIALQLCREMLRDYCPPEETPRVIAALIGLEDLKRKSGAEKK